MMLGILRTSITALVVIAPMVVGAVVMLVVLLTVPVVVVELVGALVVLVVVVGRVVAFMLLLDVLELVAGGATLQAKTKLQSGKAKAGCSVTTSSQPVPWVKQPANADVQHAWKLRLWCPDLMDGCVSERYSVLRGFRQRCYLKPVNHHVQPFQDMMQVHQEALMNILWRCSKGGKHCSLRLKCERLVGVHGLGWCSASHLQLLNHTETIKACIRLTCVTQSPCTARLPNIKTTSGQHRISGCILHQQTMDVLDWCLTFRLLWWWCIGLGLFKVGIPAQKPCQGFWYDRPAHSMSAAQVACRQGGGVKLLYVVSI